MAEETINERLSPEVRIKLTGQARRCRAYEEGVYDLHDDEGFFCSDDDCGWRSLVAPLNDLDVLGDMDQPLCICPECGSPVNTKEPSEDYTMRFVSEYDRRQPL